MDEYPILWKQKTNRGRVVYDREKHPFSWADAKRIVKSLPVIDLYSDTKGFVDMVETNILCQISVARAGAEAFLRHFSLLSDLKTLGALGATTRKILEIFKAVAIGKVNF